MAEVKNVKKEVPVKKPPLRQPAGVTGTRRMMSITTLHGPLQISAERST